MTIGRTDDPENPISVPAFEAAKLFGTGSRTPSGPADMVPRQQAGHMLAIDPPVKILNEALASKGPSTHDAKEVMRFQEVISRRGNRGKTPGTGYRVLPNAGDQASNANKILGLAPVRRGGAVP